MTPAEVAAVERLLSFLLDRIAELEAMVRRDVSPGYVRNKSNGAPVFGSVRKNLK